MKKYIATYGVHYNGAITREVELAIVAENEGEAEKKAKMLGEEYSNILAAEWAADEEHDAPENETPEFWVHLEELHETKGDE